MKYKLTKNLPGYGKAGDVVEFESIDNVPYNSTLRLLDKVEVEENKILTKPLKDKEELETELVNEVGFSKKRARKVSAEFGSKKELCKSLNKLPFSALENDLLKKYYSKEVKSNGSNRHTKRNS